MSSSVVLVLAMMLLLSCLPYSLCSYKDVVINNLPQSSSSRVVSVTDHGAIGDGKSNDTKAFEEAWKNVCETNNSSVLEVPGNKTFLIGPIIFSGPCKTSVTMNVNGTILASGDRSDYQNSPRHWILFSRIANFRISGGGAFDGNGKTWWNNSCKIDKSKPCIIAPTAVTFSECNNARVETVTFKNAQQLTVSLEKCIGFWGTSLVIRSPEWSPNTDGIHIAASQNVHLSHCSIKTGDDCISIEDGSKYIRATDTVCGPGHGISIGSLGDHNSHAMVSHVFVNRARLTGTTNGVRIKTWQGGSGYASNIKFENIVMDNVQNPIIIDQSYCDQKTPCKEQSEAVQVENVEYINITGTSATQQAININCSKTHTCKNIVLRNINLKTVGNGAEGVCQNAQIVPAGTVSPNCLNKMDK